MATNSTPVMPLRDHVVDGVAAAAADADDGDLGLLLRFVVESETVAKVVVHKCPSGEFYARLCC